MAIVYNTNVVRNGLVLYLDAANVKSYPGTGTVWTDLSGRGNHGTMSTVTFATNTMTLDADGDYISVNHSSDFNFSSIMTISAWIKVSSFSTASIYNVLSKKPSFNNTQKGWSCQYDYRTTGVLQFRNNDATTLNDSTPTANVDNTALLNQTTTYCNSVWVINGTAVSFYINGQARGTGTAAYTNTDTTTPIYIGKTLGSIGDPALLSQLSCISVYNRALTAAEIQTNYNALRGRYGI